MTETVVPMHGIFLPVLWISEDYVNPSCDSRLTNPGGVPSLQNSVRSLPLVIKTNMLTSVFSL